MTTPASMAGDARHLSPEATTIESGNEVSASPIMSAISPSRVAAAPFLPTSSVPQWCDGANQPLLPSGLPPLPPPPPDTFILSFTYPPPPAPIAIPTSAPIRKPPNYIGFTHPPPPEAPPVLGPGEKVAASVSTYYTNFAGIGLPEHKQAAIVEADRHVGPGKDKVPQWCWDDMRAYAKELEDVYGVKAEARPSRKRKQYRDEEDLDISVVIDTGSYAAPTSNASAQNSTSSDFPSRHVDPLATLSPPRPSTKSIQARKKDATREVSPSMTIKSDGSDPSSSGSGSTDSSYGDADAWTAKKGRMDVMEVTREVLSKDAAMGQNDEHKANETSVGIAEHETAAIAFRPPTMSPGTPPTKNGIFISTSSKESRGHKKTRSPSADSGMIILDEDINRAIDQTEDQRDELGSESDSESDIEIDRDDSDGEDDALTIKRHGQTSPSYDAPEKLPSGAEGEIRCPGWEWTLKGTWQAVIAARADIYEITQPAVRFNIRIPGRLILDGKAPPPTDITSSPDLLPAVRTRLDELASSFGVWITIISLVQQLGWRYSEAYASFLAADKNIASESAQELHTLREEREAVIRDGRDHEVMILGRQDQLESAKRALLVLIDELSGCASLVVRVPMYLHPAISGKKRAILTTLTAQSGVLCYFPTPDMAQEVVRDIQEPTSPTPGQETNGDIAVVPSLTSTHAAAGPATIPPSPPVIEDEVRESDKIILTGTEESVRKVKNTLSKLADNKAKLEQPEKVYCVPQKLDFLLTRRSDSIRRCMHDSGTFVSFPPLGSEGNVLEVTGDDDNARTRTMKQVMMMTCELACAQVSLIATGSAEHPTADIISLLLSAIVPDHDLDLIVRDSQFELWGSITDLRKAMSVITTSGTFAAYQSEVQIQLELSLEDKDFIQGKYAGKTRRIMRASDARLKMQNFNGYTLLVEIGGSLTTALLAFDLLAEELPTNISFCIPYNHHRRLIGRYGDAIQAIMRRYSCYIRMGAPMSSAGSVENEDNVWAQSPAKFSHSHNLLGMRGEVLLLIDEKDRDYSLTSVDIPRQYHRLLQFRKTLAIKAIEREAGVTIFFPAPQSGEDAVYIYGSKMSNDHAKALFPNLMEQNSATPIVENPTASQPARFFNKAHRQGYSTDPRSDRRFRNPHQKVYARNGKAFGYQNSTPDHQEMRKPDAIDATPAQPYIEGYQRWNKADSTTDQRGRSATVTSMGSSTSPSLDIDLARNPASLDGSMTTASTQMTSDVSTLATPVNPPQENASYVQQQSAGYSWLASGPGPGGVGGQFHVVTKDQPSFGSTYVLASPIPGIASTYGSAAMAYQPDWIAPSAATQATTGQHGTGGGWNGSSANVTSNGQAQYAYPPVDWYPVAGSDGAVSYAAPAIQTVSGSTNDMHASFSYGGQAYSQGYTGSYQTSLPALQQPFKGGQTHSASATGYAPHTCSTASHITSAFQPSNIWRAPGC